MIQKLDLTINDDACLEVSNISSGAFSPLRGFMTSKEYRNVVDHMILEDGTPWTMPITLDIGEKNLKNIANGATLRLFDRIGDQVADLQVEDVFDIDIEQDLEKIFKTTEMAHPGVKKECERSRFRIGGTIVEVEKSSLLSERHSLSPRETKTYFKGQGWKTIVGFQTRNPPHKAHEYLQRIALEVADGVFIQPLIGWKKSGDFMPNAILDAYEVMIKEFYPKNKALLGVLQTPMRYAGPREAVFHAIIRRNYGCTHFVVGRDHAGVGGYYGKYEAQELAQSIPNLGISILGLAGPRYCSACGGIVSENSCAHHTSHISEISGTDIRNDLMSNKHPDTRLMRSEISRVLLDSKSNGQLFCEVT